MATGTRERSSDKREPSPHQKGSTAFVIVLAVAFILAGAPAGLILEVSAEVFPLDAIGRLIIDDDGQCTAFVIRSSQIAWSPAYRERPTMFENWLATAGHCLGQDMVFQQGRQAHAIRRLIGLSTWGTHGYDVMILAFYTHQRMPTLELAFGEYPQVGDKLMLIGYGRGALMMRVNQFLGYNERGHMEVDGVASVGNSGGPVLIPGTRRVIGIGIETTLARPAGVNESYCRFAGCPVKPPYVAAHIDRLRGIASFPSPSGDPPTARP